MPTKTILRAISIVTLLIAPAIATAQDKLTDGDFVIGPTYVADKDTKVIPGVPQGEVHHFVLDSGTSKIFPVDRAGKPFKREVWVYVPAGYVPETEICLMVVQDGGNYHNVVTRSLDNLIHDHRVPPMVAVMLNPGTGKAQRSFEYDTVSSDYTNFIETEILPKVETDYKIKITKDPEGRSSFGTSSGAAAAFTMGWFHPELYHRIFTYSGTFVDLQHSDEYPHGAWEYAEHLIPNSPAKPLRVALEVGQNDIGAKEPESGHRNWPLANVNMAKALKAKEYHYHFAFARSANHVDEKVISQTFPQTMVWLWEGYSIK